MIDLQQLHADVRCAEIDLAAELKEQEYQRNALLRKLATEHANRKATYIATHYPHLAPNHEAEMQALRVRQSVERDTLQRKQSLEVKAAIGPITQSLVAERHEAQRKLAEQQAKDKAFRKADVTAARKALSDAQFAERLRLEAKQ